MPHVVIDTNVWIAAFRSRRGVCAKLAGLVGSGLFEMHISQPLVMEYEEKLLGHREATGQSAEDVARLIRAICRIGIPQEIYYLWRGHTRDPEDAHVLELAIAADCDCIVTYNKKDFPEAPRFGLDVLTALEFLKRIGQIK